MKYETAKAPLKHHLDLKYWCNSRALLLLFSLYFIACQLFTTIKLRAFKSTCG